MPVGGPEPRPYDGGVRQSLTEQVYARLKDDILKARRQPDSVLLEHQLAQEYGVSKTPIREALRLLAQEGWVVVMPRRGYWVRALRFEDLREIFTLRLILESALVPAAVERSTAVELDRLEQLARDQVAAGEDLDAALHAAGAFHEGLARLAENQRAERMLTALFDESRRVHYLVAARRERLTEPRSMQDHFDLVKAMRRKDVAAAQEIMERHLRDDLHQAISSLTGISRLST